VGFVGSGAAFAIGTGAGGALVWGTGGRLGGLSGNATGRDGFVPVFPVVEFPPGLVKSYANPLILAAGRLLPLPTGAFFCGDAV
jgi:hypothetical protein